VCVCACVCVRARVCVDVCVCVQEKSLETVKTTSCVVCFCARVYEASSNMIAGVIMVLSSVARVAQRVGAGGSVIAHTSTPTDIMPALGAGIAMTNAMSVSVIYGTSYLLMHACRSNDIAVQGILRRMPQYQH